MVVVEVVVTRQVLFATKVAICVHLCPVHTILIQPKPHPCNRSIRSVWQCAERPIDIQLGARDPLIENIARGYALTWVHLFVARHEYTDAMHKRVRIFMCMSGLGGIE